VPFAPALTAAPPLLALLALLQPPTIRVDYKTGVLALEYSAFDDSFIVAA
jgi:hypothetical protein